MSRTVRNGDALYQKRRSRKDRACDTCFGEIHRGETYYTSVLPPGRDVNSGKSWWRISLCEPCGAPAVSAPPADQP